MICSLKWIASKGSILFPLSRVGCWVEWQVECWLGVAPTLTPALLLCRKVFQAIGVGVGPFSGWWPFFVKWLSKGCLCSVETFGLDYPKAAFAPCIVCLLIKCCFNWFQMHLNAFQVHLTSLVRTLFGTLRNNPLSLYWLSQCLRSFGCAGIFSTFSEKKFVSSRKSRIFALW